MHILTQKHKQYFAQTPKTVDCYISDTLWPGCEAKYDDIQYILYDMLRCFFFFTLKTCLRYVKCFYLGSDRSPTTLHADPNHP